MGFLLFSIPLITASLGLAQTSSIDARVKTDITERHYCGLAVQEYFSYLLTDGTRWTTWLTDNLDPSDPTGDTSTETVDICGRNITVTVGQQSLPPSDSYTDPPSGDATPTIPPLSSYNNRKFQTLKTVSDSKPPAGSSVTYTITVINRDENPTTLNQIEDTLPDGFSYDCTGPKDQLTLPGMAPVNIEPDNGPCPAGPNIEWDMSPGTSIESGDAVTLTFTAAASFALGTYCNEAQVVPGGNKTSSGKTAIVQIGLLPGLCTGEAALVRKTVDGVSLVSADTSTDPYTYTLDVDYTIWVDNIGSSDVAIKEIIDLLPKGFSYDSINLAGDITAAPAKLEWISSVERQQITWKFNTVTSALGDVVSELQQVVDDNPGTPLADKAQDALAASKTALDEFSNPPYDYLAVMNNIEGAVGDLESAIAASLFDPEQQAIDLMVELTGVARAIAQTTLDLTIADGGDPGDISTAQQALADGDVLRAAGAYKNAVNKYKNALSVLPWYFVPDFSNDIGAEVPSGETKTLKFSATASVTRGDYWSDVTVDFSGGAFPDDIYTWPTGLVAVRDVHNATATDENGNVIVIDLQLWVGSDQGLIDTWDLR